MELVKVQTPTHGFGNNVFLIFQRFGGMLFYLKVKRIFLKYFCLHSNTPSWRLLIIHNVSLSDWSVNVVLQICDGFFIV